VSVRVLPAIRKTAALLVLATHLVTVIGADAVAASTLPRAETALPEWMLLDGPPAPIVQEPPPPAPQVTVNRLVPPVIPPTPMPVFSAAPTEAEITRARVFEEPLLPVGGAPTATENRVLAAAMSSYLQSGGSDRVLPFTSFLANYPGTAWRASLMTNLGLVYRRTGHFSRALRVWDEAWNFAKSAGDRAGRAVADRAVGELFELNARLGRFDELEQLFNEIDGRDVRGSASQKVSGARQALWLMKNKPGQSFLCGPLALNEILAYGKAQHEMPKPIELCWSTIKGTNLAAMKELAVQVGMNMQVAFRTPGSAVITPALVHWKVGHFAALVAQDGDRILMRDPTFGTELWLSRATLDEEASGFFLIRNSVLGSGWRAVEEAEARDVWGKGQVAGIDPDDYPPDYPDCPNCPPPGGPPPGGPPPGGRPPSRLPPAAGMAQVSINMLHISTNVRDTPIWYTPPKGPAVEFTASYRQRENAQPQTFSYVNLGPKWTFNWLSYIEDDPTNPAAPASVYQRGGGKDTSTGYASGSYAPTTRTQALIMRTASSPIRYERQLPDGSVEVYAQPDGASTFPRKVFLTQLKDAQGNALTFTWDANMRIIAVTDALGQVTTVTYELASDPLKITKITDPFGRTATLAYDSDGRLQSMTDLLGLQSQFTYGTNDAIATVTTPYGVTRVTWGEDSIKRWAEVTDPTGGRERVQYGAAVVASDPVNTLPQGMLIDNELSHHNTLYWNKVAMAKAPGDPASATDYSWMRKAGVSVAVPQAIKKPLENRVWYNYHGGSATSEGTVRKVSAEGRVLDDGTTQLFKSEYNTRGRITKRIDPLGRETIYEYDATGLDLLRVKQKNGASYDLLETRTYNSQHLPLTVTDAAGQTTTYTYNAAGQILTVTNAQNDTSTFAYNSSGFLTSMTGPIGGAVTTFTYDSYGRLRTVTRADSYVLTYDYDTAGRRTRVSYPDGTYDETIYDRLDPAIARDRLGRITRHVYSSTRQLLATTDPAGRTTT
jgi:YD repeat-containing protein